MPTAREVSDKYRAALLKREQAMVKSLIASYKNTYVRLSDKIKALEGEIMALPEAERKAWKVMRLGRWKALRQQVEDELAAFGVIVRDVSQNGHRESIAAGLEFALRVWVAHPRDWKVISDLRHEVFRALREKGIAPV